MIRLPVPLRPTRTDSAIKPRTSFRRLSAVVTTVTALIAGACGKTDGPSGNGPPPQPTGGSLVISVSGLPSGASAAISVSGPNGYSRSLTGQQTINGLPAGNYTVTGQQVSAAGTPYVAEPAEQVASVVAGSSASVNVSYAPLPGSLAITVGGLPEGAAPSLTLTGPGGFTRSVTASGNITGLVPGAYTLTAANVAATGHTYAPSVTTLNVTVVGGSAAATASITYQLATGAMTVAFSGLPAGATGSATVAGPGNFSRTVSATETLTNLPPGAYTVTSAAVVADGDTYRALAAPLQVTVQVSMDPVMASIPYSLATGRLAVSISGLPNGATPTVSISGPQGYSRTVTAATTVSGLSPGSYTVTAASVTVGSQTYSPPAPQTVNVQATAQPVSVGIAYGVTTGSLTVAVLGLPQSVQAAITVTGPGGYSANVTATQTLSNLAPGTYTVNASTTTATHIYAPATATQTVNVTVGSTPANVTVTYALASGSISISISGLPNGTLANMVVSGPNGYTRNVTATTLLLGLTPGTYTVAASAVTAGSGTYGPTPNNQTINVVASTSAVPVVVNYALASGSLAVTINGLPNGVNGNVTVTGPNGYNSKLTSSQTLIALGGGTYTVTAQPVSSGATTYAPSATTQTVSLIAGTTAHISVTYGAAGAGINLLIDGMYLVQAVQRYDNTVPLIGNRDAFLRVFVKATSTNTATPAVRARIYNGATLVSTININAPGSSVPTAIDQAIVAQSWNATIPASLIQPGYTIVADVDPTNAISEANETDNTFPSSGTPMALDVRSVSTMQLRMVPVFQSANGMTGNVSNANKSQFVVTTGKIYPLNMIDVDVRATYTTNAPALVADDANGAWQQILSEINALRTADANSRYYYGVVKTTYTSGVAGLGYVPGRAAVGWDFLPSGDEIQAHELGHNFGRLHAPCGGAGGPDPNYPYAGGAIGVYGYDVAAGVLKYSTQPDIMAYCSNDWISDYNYLAVLNYRASNPAVMAASSSAPRPGLLVWGRVHRGQLILEPAFEVMAPPSLPPRRGTHRLLFVGERGETLLDVTFEPQRVADSRDPNDASFAFVIPTDALRGGTLDRIRLSALGRTVELRSVARGAAGVARALVTAPSDLPRASRTGDRQLQLSWTAPTIRGVLVRDPRTGDILSFARGGHAVVRTDADDLEVVVSDGVRSERHRLNVK